jgi:hypothetical protein
MTVGQDEAQHAAYAVELDDAIDAQNLAPPPSKNTVVGG